MSGRLIHASLAALAIASGTALADAGWPEGAQILHSEGTPGACRGQTILSHPAEPHRAATLYAGHLATAGFDLTDLSDATTSFFVGHRSGCAAVLYLERDEREADRSTVVVRYLEE